MLPLYRKLVQLYALQTQSKHLEEIIDISAIRGGCLLCLYPSLYLPFRMRRKLLLPLREVSML